MFHKVLGFHVAFTAIITKVLGHNDIPMSANTISGIEFWFSSREDITIVFYSAYQDLPLLGVIFPLGADHIRNLFCILPSTIQTYREPCRTKLGSPRKL